MLVVLYYRLHQSFFTERGTIMEIGYGYRFDYARIRYSTDHDLAQQKCNELKELIQLWKDNNPTQADGGFEFRVFPGGAAGERQYCLELWGSISECITWLDFTEYADRLMRLDVRASLPTATAQGIRELGDRLAQRKGRLNITRYESKARSKMRGRNAGGVGVALGSHKSVYRATVYKRSNEPGALEFQYSGAALTACVNTTTKRRSIPLVDNDPWAALRTHTYVSGMQRLENSSGVEYSTLLDIVGGIRSSAQEDRLDQLELGIMADWRLMPAERKPALLALFALDVP